MLNASPTQQSIVSVQDSINGTTWNPILVSTPTTALNLSVTLVPGAYAHVLFVSIQQYVRVVLDAANADGVFVHLVEWPPIQHAPGTGYA